MAGWLHHFWFTWGWPSDKGNGPEGIQQTVIYALIGLLLWPPVRRRVHRFKNAAIDDVKRHVSAEQAALHTKLDEVKSIGLHIVKHHPDIPDWEPPVPSSGP